MLYCALKSDCMAYMIFTGRVDPANQPAWYVDMFDKNSYENEFNYWVISDIKSLNDELVPWEDTLTEGVDVFLRNKVGNIRRTDIYQLDSRMIEVADGTVALSENCLPYVIFTGGDPDKYPEWFQDFYYNTLKNIMKDNIVLPIVVLMKEKWDDDELEVRYQIVEFELFKQNYYFQGAGINWDAFR